MHSVREIHTPNLNDTFAACQVNADTQEQKMYGPAEIEAFMRFLFEKRTMLAASLINRTAAAAAAAAAGVSISIPVDQAPWSEDQK